MSEWTVVAQRLQLTCPYGPGCGFGRLVHIKERSKVEQLILELGIGVLPEPALAYGVKRHPPEELTSGLSSPRHRAVDTQRTPYTLMDRVFS